MSEPGNSLYERRKLDHQCTRCGKPAAPDGQLCPRHQRSEVRRKRFAARAARARNRAAGLCAFCPRKSKAHRCLTCRVKRKASRSMGVANGVAQLASRLDRIRAQTAVGDDGRVRYHGQLRRGRQSIAALNKQDIESVIRESLRCLDGLALAYSPESEALPMIQRRAAERAALSLLDLAGRLVEEVLDRSGYREHLAAQEAKR